MCATLLSLFSVVCDWLFRGYMVSFWVICCCCCCCSRAKTKCNLWQLDGVGNLGQQEKQQQQYNYQCNQRDWKLVRQKCIFLSTSSPLNQLVMMTSTWQESICLECVRLNQTNIVLEKTRRLLIQLCLIIHRYDDDDDDDINVTRFQLDILICMERFH